MFIQVLFSSVPFQGMLSFAQGSPGGIQHGYSGTFLFRTYLRNTKFAEGFPGRIQHGHSGTCFLRMITDRFQGIFTR